MLLEVLIHTSITNPYLPHHKKKTPKTLGEPQLALQPHPKHSSLKKPRAVSYNRTRHTQKIAEAGRACCMHQLQPILQQDHPEQTALSHVQPASKDCQEGDSTGSLVSLRWRNALLLYIKANRRTIYLTLMQSSAYMIRDHWQTKAIFAHAAQNIFVR